MKVSFSHLAIFALLISGTLFSAQAQQFARLDKSPADIVVHRQDGEPQIKVVYSRPAKRERTVFGDLVPFGQVWRTGANEATEIRLYKDATVMGKPLPAGIYSLFTIPTEQSWTIIFSSQTDVWGAYQYNESYDVLRVEVPNGDGEEVLEYFGITFQEVDDAVHLVLGWDYTRIAVPFKF